MKLTSADIKGLDVQANPCDLRRDLHAFADYVRERRIKRAHRSNDIPKADAKRLAKLLSDPEAEAEFSESGSSTWLDFIDGLALRLGFVRYDTEGRYMGYTSTEPSFPDNYIQFMEKPYENFLALSLQDQERRLLDCLVDDYGYSRNEFFTSHAPLGRLDGFDAFGCATGVLPHLNFAESRRFLLDLLKDCESETWYDTASLIAYLKTHHPYFLIPQHPEQSRGVDKGRYGNFCEHRGDRWSNRTPVLDTDPDAFERVEGRYLERFFEGIPLTLGYVEVAYGEKPDAALFPSLGELRAFRLKPLFFRSLRDGIGPPQVTVLPNFEIQVAAEIYPARIMAELKPLTEVVATDKAIILKLDKKKVAEQLVRNESLNVVELLRRLNARELPQNVLTELEEWSGHTEVFTLYQGFGLLEGKVELPAVDELTVERIGAAQRIIRAPDEVYSHLQQAEQVPLRIEHGERALQRLPKTAKSVFPKASPKTEAKRQAKDAVVHREIKVTLTFPNDELLNHFRKDLLEARCPIEVDPDKRTITLPQVFEGNIAASARRLKKDYRIRIEDGKAS